MEVSSKLLLLQFLDHIYYFYLVALLLLAFLSLRPSKLHIKLSVPMFFLSLP